MQMCEEISVPRSATRYDRLGNSGKEEYVFADEMAQEAEGYIDLLMPDHPISLDETEYVDLCFSYQDLINLGMPPDVPLHIIGFEPAIDYKEALHMHDFGVAMFNEVIRGGEVMHRASVDYFDFAQSGIFEVQQDTFTIKPGDSIRTSCSFNTTSSKKSIEYGFGSQDEMCLSYMYDYFTA